MAQSLRQPKSLLRYCIKKINRIIPCEDAIYQLHIPNILKKQLSKYYLEDKFTCEELFPPLEPREMPIWFDEPFLNLSNDEFLTIMNWNYGVPFFAFERNHIKYVYYTYDDGTDKYCAECSNIYLKNIAKYKIEKWSCCEFEYGDTLIQCLQGPDSWCHNCMTRSLFWIEEWVWNTDHLNFRCLQKIDTHYI